MKTMKQRMIAIVGIVLMFALMLTACHKADTNEAATEAAAQQVTVTQSQELTSKNTDNTKKAEAAKTTKAAKKTEAAKTTKAAKKTEKATKKVTKAATKKTTEATGSPVQRFQGRYGNGRCTIDVVGVANNSVEIHVYWSSSAWEHSEWTMSGNFDEDANGFYVYYSDAVRTDYKYNDDGTKESSEKVYVGGKGSFRFNGNKMTWDDQAEHIADGMVFTK